MTITQHSLDFVPRPKLRLSEVERFIRTHRIFNPPLSRRRLIELCENGTLETAPREAKRSPWLVYEDSFMRWIKQLDGK